MTSTSSRTLNAIYRYRDKPDAIVEAGEVADMRFPSGGKMSLRGGKLFHLLIQAAGVNIAEPQVHRIALSELNKSFHTSVQELTDLIDELHSTTIKLNLTDSNGRRYMKSGPVLADAEREADDQAQAEMRFEFSPAMRKAIGNSTHWAVISKKAVLAFESRYSLHLYTKLALRSRRRHVAEKFTVEEIREMLGVPAGKLKDWKSLRRRALEPALEEIDHLASFHAAYTPIKHGRKVIGVKLIWGMKDPGQLKAAKHELEQHKIGRKARREERVERVLEEKAIIEGRMREALATDLTSVIASDEPD